MEGRLAVFSQFFSRTKNTNPPPHKKTEWAFLRPSRNLAMFPTWSLAWSSCDSTNLTHYWAEKGYKNIIFLDFNWKENSDGKYDNLIRVKIEIFFSVKYSWMEMLPKCTSFFHKIFIFGWTEVEYNQRPAHNCSWSTCFTKRTFQQHIVVRQAMS